MFIIKKKTLNSKKKTKFSGDPSEAVLLGLKRGEKVWGAEKNKKVCFIKKENIFFLF